MADQTGEMENDLSYLIISSFLVVITLFVCAYNFETSSSIHFGNQFSPTKQLRLASYMNTYI